jgi:hypothetical protein
MRRFSIRSVRPVMRELLLERYRKQYNVDVLPAYKCNKHSSLLKAKKTVHFLRFHVVDSCVREELVSSKNSSNRRGCADKKQALDDIQTSIARRRTLPHLKEVNGHGTY